MKNSSMIAWTENDVRKHKSIHIYMCKNERHFIQIQIGLFFIK